MLSAELMLHQSLRSYLSGYRMDRPRIEITEDGSPTLIHSIIGDSYHSLHGALTESNHIYIGAGFDYLCGDDISILEVGFGSGLNAMLTLRRSEATARRVHYIAIELYPLDIDTAEALEYSNDPCFKLLHSCEWGADADITPNFTLRKECIDLLRYNFDGVFDLIYFDAFAPDSQPELWSEEVFRSIFNSMRSGGVLVTYSSKGVVKRALRSVGFEVTRLMGPVGKRHILRAVKL